MCVTSPIPKRTKDAIPPKAKRFEQKSRWKRQQQISTEFSRFLYDDDEAKEENEAERIKNSQIFLHKLLYFLHNTHKRRSKFANHVNVNRQTE